MSRRAVPYPCAWLPVPDRSWRPDGVALTAAEAMVLAVLVDRWRRSEGDVVAIGTNDLADSAGLSVRGAEGARGALIERRLIVKIHEGGGRGNPSIYRLGAWSKRAAEPRTENGEAEHENPAPVNPVTAAETPHSNPAISGGYSGNHAPNPALFSPVGAGFEAPSPFTKAESEAEGETLCAPVEVARRALIRLYAERYQRETTDAWMGASGQADRISVVAAWCVTERDPADAARRVVDGAFATERLRPHRWPWRYIAEDPAKYAAASTLAHTSTSSDTSGIPRIEVSP